MRELSCEPLGFKLVKCRFNIPGSSYVVKESQLIDGVESGRRIKGRNVVSLSTRPIDAYNGQRSSTAFLSPISLEKIDSHAWKIVRVRIRVFDCDSRPFRCSGCRRGGQHGYPEPLVATRYPPSQTARCRTGGRLGRDPRAERRGHAVRRNKPRRLAKLQRTTGTVEGDGRDHGNRSREPDRSSPSGKFGDVQLHVEWASPNPPAGKGQGRGNSGIFLMGLYELQVLDSYGADTYADGFAGAIYGQYPPLANASRPPGQWQTYDIAFRRPRFDKDGKIVEPARMTVIHNGILIQNNEELWGRTDWLETSPYEANPDRGPIQLQDHGHPVRFRNIWIRELARAPASPRQRISPDRTSFRFPSRCSTR